MRRAEPIAAPRQLPRSPALEATSGQRSRQPAVQRSQPPPTAAEVEEAQRIIDLAHTRSKQRISRAQEQSAYTLTHIEELGRASAVATSTASAQAATIAQQGKALASLAQQLSEAVDKAATYESEYRALYTNWKLQRSLREELEQEVAQLKAQLAPYQPSDAEREARAEDS